MQYFTQQPSFLWNNLKAMIQGEYAPYTVLKFYCFFILIGIPSFLLAQLHQFPAIYPALPFEIQKASALGYNKCTVWEGIYRKTESDQSGYIWSTIEQESHQSKKFVFFEGVLDIVSNYAPSGDKVWTMEYFYKQGLLSAIERLSFDSLQESSLEYAYAYFYRFDSIPFQRVKMFGFPNKKLRLLEAFEFDNQDRLLRTKSTVSGSGPQMDSLVSLQTGEQLLSLHEFDSQYIANRLYKNLYVILKDEKTFLDTEGRFSKTEYRDADGKLIAFVDYSYEQGRLVQKTHWKMPTPEVQEVQVSSNKKQKNKSKKKRTTSKDNTADSTIVTAVIPNPILIKKEFFTFSTEGLIETHLIEENGRQTVLEYTFFME